MEPTKKDWKLFRDKIGDWQEAYMEKLVKQYAVYLNGNDAASTKFWEMEKRIKQDKKTPGVFLELSKGNMMFDIVQLLKDGVITFNDLEDFSEELKAGVKMLMDRFGIA